MATPLLEDQAVGNSTSALLTASCSSLIETGRRVVTDCPAYAWDNSDQPALYDLADTFGDDLAETHRATLDQAAHRLIAAHLVTEWQRRGYDVVFVYGKSAYESGATPGPDGTQYFVPADEVYHQVWQAAADAITDKDLVRQADLGHVFQMLTDLERHRAALHHRLDEWASGDMCDRAEQQLEGLRAAVDHAVTRAQLVEISALIA